MDRSWQLREFISHWRKAARWDAFHSPYLFELFTQCTDSTNVFQNQELIELQRKKLLRSDESISRRDYGAGSVVLTQQSVQKISSIARHALSSPAQCCFLAKLVRFLNAGTVLELGTSFGISAAYMAHAKPDAHIITVEGDPGVANVAESVFKGLGLYHIQLVNETFENFLNSVHGINRIDLCYLDGNHQSKALLQYFKMLLPLTHEKTVFVIDDIHWSKDMWAGWNQLIHHPAITQSVDCFRFGLLFFNQDFLQNQNHLVRLPLRYYL